MVEGGGVRVEFNEESCVYTVANTYLCQRKWEISPLVDISTTNQYLTTQKAYEVT